MQAPEIIENELIEISVIADDGVKLERSASRRASSSGNRASGIVSIGGGVFRSLPGWRQIRSGYGSDMRNY
jgi:hypothetical protein